MNRLQQSVNSVLPSDEAVELQHVDPLDVTCLDSQIVEPDLALQTQHVTVELDPVRPLQNGGKDEVIDLGLQKDSKDLPVLNKQHGLFDVDTSLLPAADGKPEIPSDRSSVRVQLSNDLQVCLTLVDGRRDDTLYGIENDKWDTMSGIRSSATVTHFVTQILKQACDDQLPVVHLSHLGSVHWGTFDERAEKFVDALMNWKPPNGKTLCVMFHIDDRTQYDVLRCVLLQRMGQVSIIAPT
jgi:hypothetical protein